MDRAQLWKLNSKLDIVNKHSFKVNRPSLSITIRRFLSFWTIFTSPWIIWNVHLLMDLMFSLHLKKRERWKTVTDRLTDILLLGDRSVLWKPPHSSLKRNWIGVDEFKIRKRASSSSMAWAACGLFPLPCSCQNKWLSLRCKDFYGQDFSNSLSLDMLKRYVF